MRKITSNFAKMPLSFYRWGTQHTIRIHALHEEPVKAPARQYNFFVLLPYDAFCLRKSLPINTSSKEKKVGGEKVQCFIYLKYIMKGTSPNVLHYNKHTAFLQLLRLIT